MHATENYKFRFWSGSCTLSKFERVTCHIGKLDHFITLVMMAENKNSIAQRRFGGLCAHDQIRIARCWKIARATHSAFTDQITCATEQERRTAQLGRDYALGELAWGGDMIQSSEAFQRVFDLDPGYREVRCDVA